MTVDETGGRQAVTDALHRYAACLDSFDCAGIRKLFTDDASFRSVPMLASGVVRGVTPALPVVVEGATDIASFVEAMVEPLQWQHHMLSVYEVTIVGDTAKALTYLVSHKTRTDAPDQVNVVTGRYWDSLVRVGSEWKIYDKLMEIGWMETRSVLQGPLIDSYVARAAESISQSAGAR